MSVLAVYLEQKGISTVVVGSIRLHLEKVKPPRALWVPFELGRPLGGWIEGDDTEDANGGFQLKVLSKALSLLDSPVATPVLDDFDLEDPSKGIDQGWQAPSMSACKSVSDEVRYLYSDWQEWQQKRGTQTGLGGMEILDAVDYVERFGSANPASNPGDDLSDTLRYRFCVDDIKAFYLEAAMNRGFPNSQQLGRWLWNECRVGALLKQHRAENSNNEDDSLKLVYDKFLVPGAWQ